MNKKTLTLALLAATLAVTCVQLTAGQPTGIRVESVGMPAIKLNAQKSIAPLPCSDFHQYQIIGHYSNLTLGTPPKVADHFVSTSSRPTKRQWIRLFLSSDSRTRPLDLFKSATQENSGTGHVVISCRPVELSKNTNKPFLNLSGSTVNPTGNVVLCVDFVPRRPKPRGSLNLSDLTIRDGQKVRLSWNRTR